MPESLKGYSFVRGKDSIPALEIGRELRDARAAKFWNKTLPEFRAMEVRDQAESIAVYMVEQQIESYYASEMEKRREKK
ncbi:MAG: hypothetical protein DA330_09590 [Nitrososphaera sp.]|nr:hypothetical protein [Nitrososphaera sp.]